MIAPVYPPLFRPGARRNRDLYSGICAPPHDCLPAALSRNHRPDNEHDRSYLPRAKKKSHPSSLLLTLKPFPQHITCPSPYIKGSRLEQKRKGRAGGCRCHFPSQRSPLEHCPGTHRRVVEPMQVQCPQERPAGHHLARLQPRPGLGLYEKGVTLAAPVGHRHSIHPDTLDFNDLLFHVLPPSMTIRFRSFPEPFLNISAR